MDHSLIQHRDLVDQKLPKHQKRCNIKHALRFESAIKRQEDSVGKQSFCDWRNRHRIHEHPLAFGGGKWYKTELRTYPAKCIALEFFEMLLINLFTIFFQEKKGNLRLLYIRIFTYIKYAPCIIFICAQCRHTFVIVPRSNPFLCFISLI